ncbi:phosphotransferase [Streptomyces daliensis]
MPRNRRSHPDDHGDGYPTTPGPEPESPGAEETLHGGHLTEVVRQGNRVRRSTGPWSPAVHALLDHLAKSGFTRAPRLLDVDEEKGYEYLSYLPGEVGYPPIRAPWQTDEALRAAAHLIREYHDAVADFTPPENARWRFMVGAPRTGEIICHNDIANYNLLYSDGLPSALIDWDFAAPAGRTWDLAQAMWYLVPLHTPAYCRSVGWAEVDVPRRLRLFCDAYGLPEDDRVGLIDLVAERQTVTFRTMDTWAAQGVPGFAELVENPPEITERADAPHLRRHRDLWQRALL